MYKLDRTMLQLLGNGWCTYSLIILVTVTSLLLILTTTLIQISLPSEDIIGEALIATKSMELFIQVEKQVHIFLIGIVMVSLGLTIEAGFTRINSAKNIREWELL